MILYNWQTPKKPSYSRGRIVIHSDDGRLYDYTRYFKIIQRTIGKYNQFKPLSAGIFCPGINTGYVDEGWHETVDLPMMSWEMIEEIDRSGGEILSHGKYHLFLSSVPITHPVNAGDTTIRYSMSQGRPREGFKFYITDGTNRDDYTVVNYEHLGTGEDNHMNITPALNHDYNTNARIHLHEDMMDEQLNGIISELSSRGIECKHHINAWYSNSDTARGYLEQYFDSVITSQHSKTKIQNPSEVDIYNIERTQDMRHYSLAEIDELLDDIISKDGVGFIQNHGGIYHTTFRNLEYLVSQAMERGVRVTTHSEAVEYIKSKQV